jgi:hypothetical protein
MRSEFIWLWFFMYDCSCDANADGVVINFRFNLRLGNFGL